MAFLKWFTGSVGVFAAATLFFASPVHADDSLYLGGSIWRASWNVGLMDKQSQNSVNGTPIASAISNAALALAFGSVAGNQYTTAFMNAPADAQMTNVGLFGAYNFAGLWALTFNVAYGTTNFQSSRDSLFARSNPQSSCGSGCTTLASTVTSFTALDHSVNVDRYDVDILMSRRISETPFGIFGGLKIQDWSYESAPVTGLRPTQYTQQPLGGSLMTGSATGFANFKYSYSSRAWGPALGAQYTLSIDKEQAIAFQAGLIYLLGSLQMSEVNSGLDGGITVSNGVTTSSVAAAGYAFKDKVTDTLNLPGYTFAVSYRRALGENVSLRIGLFYQEMIAKSTDPKDTGLTVIVAAGASPVVFPATPKRLQPEFSVGGARDVFKGISAAVTTRIW